MDIEWKMNGFRGDTPEPACSRPQTTESYAARKTQQQLYAGVTKLRYNSGEQCGVQECRHDGFILDRSPEQPTAPTALRL